MKSAPNPQKGALNKTDNKKSTSGDSGAKKETLKIK